MGDVFQRNAESQRAEARMGQALCSAIEQVVSRFGSGATFPYRDGECRVKLEDGLTRMDFVRNPDGLIWSLTASGGYAGTVSFSAIARSWYNTNSTREEIDAALKGIEDAWHNDSIRAASATDVPSLNSPLSRSTNTPQRGAVPSNERRAWTTLDTFLRRDGQNAITLKTTTREEATRLGHQPAITISRARNGSIVVTENLYPWQDAMVGRHFEIPRDRSEPIVFYPNVDDGLTRVLDQETNMTLLKQWLSAANAQRKGAS